MNSSLSFFFLKKREKMQKKKLYQVGTNAPEFRRAIQVMDVLPNPKARTKAVITSGLS